MVSVNLLHNKPAHKFLCHSRRLSCLRLESGTSWAGPGPGPSSATNRHLLALCQLFLTTNNSKYQTSKTEESTQFLITQKSHPSSNQSCLHKLTLNCCILASWVWARVRKVRILVSDFVKHKTSNQPFVKRNHFYFPSCNHHRSTQRKERLIAPQNKISKTDSLLANAVKHCFFWYGNSFSQGQTSSFILTIT